MITRRHWLLGMSALAGACQSRHEFQNPDVGRLHARPDETSSLRLPATGGSPKPLGLGAARDGAIYVPATYAAATPAPLFVFLHGAGGAGRWAIERVAGNAERVGAIVIAPDSRDATWGVIQGSEEPDLAFLDDVLEAAFATFAIDSRRIGIGGFSDGATAALSHGLVNGDLFSAITAFSPGFLHTTGPARGNPRIFISHGTRDEILPIERCGRPVAEALRSAGYRVEYREFDGNHTVPEEIGREGLEWLVRSS